MINTKIRYWKELHIPTQMKVIVQEVQYSSDNGTTITSSFYRHGNTNEIPPCQYEHYERLEEIIL